MMVERTDSGLILRGPDGKQALALTFVQGQGEGALLIVGPGVAHELPLASADLKHLEAVAGRAYRASIFALPADAEPVVPRRTESPVSRS